MVELFLLGCTGVVVFLHGVNFFFRALSSRLAFRSLRCEYTISPSTLLINLISCRIHALFNPLLLYAPLVFQQSFICRFPGLPANTSKLKLSLKNEQCFSDAILFNFIKKVQDRIFYVFSTFLLSRV